MHQSMNLLVTILLLAGTSRSEPAQIRWNCHDSPMACETYCYTTQCLNPPLENLWENGPTGTNKVNRKKSGVDPFHPCTDIDLNTYWCRTYGACPDSSRQDINTDEWPGARTLQGGTNAWLNCIDGRDNRSESDPALEVQ